MDNEKIVEKVKKLLDLAKDQTGLPEGELAAKIASELMLKYAISEEQLSKKPDILRVQFCLKNSAGWRTILMNVISKFCDCRCVFLRKSNICYIFGFSEEVELTKYLYVMIEKQLDAKAKDYYQEVIKAYKLFAKNPVAASKKRRDDFVLSAVIGVQHKLEEFKKSSFDEINSNEKALVLSRKSRVEEAFQEECGHVQSKSKMKDFNPNFDGYNAGKSVEVTLAIKDQN